MITVTLDTNLLIDIEEKRHDANFGYEDVLVILEHQKYGKIDVAVVAASASDKNVKDYSEFETWLKSLDIKAEIINPILYFGIGYWDHGLWSAQNLEELDHSVHDVLFPNFPYENPNGLHMEDKKWRNAKIDVLIVWAHIWYKRDILLTRDQRILQNTEELIKLGANNILHPRQFVQEFLV